MKGSVGQCGWLLQSGFQVMTDTPLFQDHSTIDMLIFIINFSQLAHHLHQAVRVGQPRIVIVGVFVGMNY